MRRVNITGGNLSLMDYCTAGPQFASGGFISDSKTGPVINGSQQQYFVRDSSIGDWSNGVWNQVFSGVDGAPAHSFPNPAYTTLASTPLSREKPYLTLDAAGQYAVFVPAVRKDSAGTTWEYGPTAGRPPEGNKARGAGTPATRLPSRAAPFSGRYRNTGATGI